MPLLCRPSINLLARLGVSLEHFTSDDADVVATARNSAHLARGRDEAENINFKLSIIALSS